MPMNTMPMMMPSAPFSVKNDATPAATYTIANTPSFVGDDGRRPTCPKGRLGSGRWNGPTRSGKAERRARRDGGGVADFFGVTRPLGLRLSFATTATVLRAT
jgi:hypothetical protein